MLVSNERQPYYSYKLCSTKMHVSYGNFFESLPIPKYECQAETFCYRCDKFIKNYEQNMHIGTANWGLEVVK